MAKEAIFNLKINTGNSAQDLTNLDKSIDEVAKSAGDAGKSTDSFESKLAELDAQAKSGNLSMRQLSKLTQEYTAIARQAGVNTPVGQQAIEKAAALRDEIGDLNARVNALASDSAKLDAAMQLGQGVVGGYQAVQGVMASLGVENEALLQTMVKLQAAQSIMNGLKAVENTLNKDSAVMIQAQVLGTKALTAAKALYSAVVGGATGALKAFRIALISTGIGAIVVAIGLLIANFEKLIGWVQEGYRKFTQLGQGVKVAIAVMLPIVGVIWGIIKALEYLGVIQSEEASIAEQSAKRQREAQAAILAARRKAVDEALKENERLRKSVESTYNWEIEKAKAAGKDVSELERAKRAELVKTYEKQIELLEEGLKLQRTNAAEMVRIMKQIADARANVGKLEREEELATIRENKSRTDVAKQEADKRNQIAMEEAKKMAQIRAEMLATMQQLENEYEESFLSQQQREINAVHDKYFSIIEAAKAAGESTVLLEEARQAALNEITARYEQERQDKVNELREAFLLSDQERELLELERKREARILEIEQTIEDEELKQQLLAAVQQKYNEEKAEIDKKYYDQDKKWAEMTLEEKLQLIQQYVGAAGQLVSSLSNLNEAVTNNQLKKAKGNAAEEEKIRKASFERNKKLQIAAAVIQGIQGVMAAFTAGSSMGPAGVVMGPLMAALAAVAAASNVAKIASTQYEGGGTPTASVPDMSSASAEMAGFSQSNSQVTQLNPDGTTGDQPQNQQIQVVVLESDITGTQNDLAKVDVMSSF
jgi:hypothetical protein